MKLKTLFLLSGLIVLLGFAFIHFRSVWISPLLESTANQLSREVFKNSIRIGKADLDPHFKLHAENIVGQLQTRQGPLPLELRFLASKTSLTDLLFQRSLTFDFSGLRPVKGTTPGLQGSVMIQPGPKGFIEVRIFFEQTDLKDWTWLDPQNLNGTSGSMNGSILFKNVFGQTPVFQAEVHIPEPGGNVQARFFDLLLPYLPQIPQKADLLRISKMTGFLSYRKAEIKAHLSESNHMKVFLQISIPDYNLDLNLNIEVRTDAENAFNQLAHVLGLLEVKTNGKD